MVLKNYVYDRFPMINSILQYCDIETEVIEFDNRSDLNKFLLNVDNRSETENSNEFIVTNICFNNIVVHVRRYIDYEMESDNTEIVILLCTN